MSWKMVSVAFVLGVMVPVFGYLKWHQYLTEPPKTVADAERRVTGAGFYVAGVRPYGVVISKEPITNVEANHFHLTCRKEKWLGRVGIVARPRFEAQLGAPQLPLILWGDHLVLFGDPDFIAEIVK